MLKVDDDQVPIADYYERVITQASESLHIGNATAMVHFGYLRFKQPFGYLRFKATRRYRPRQVGTCCFADYCRLTFGHTVVVVASPA